MGVDVVAMHGITAPRGRDSALRLKYAASIPETRDVMPAASTASLLQPKIGNPECSLHRRYRMSLLDLQRTCEVSVVL